LLARLARMIHTAAFRDELLAAQTPEDVLTLVRRSEQ
jgi:hypothetical protein